MSTRSQLPFPVSGGMQNDAELAAEARQAWRRETAALEAEWELAMAQAWEDWWQGIGAIRPVEHGRAEGGQR